MEYFLKKMVLLLCTLCFLVNINFIYAREVSTTSYRARLVELKSAIETPDDAARLDNQDLRKSAKVSAAYTKLGFESVDQNTLLTVNDDELRALFEAAYEAAFYTKTQSYNDLMRQFFAEAKNRKLNVNQELRDYYDMLIRTRDFEGGSRLAAKFPEIIKALLPKLEVSAGVRAGLASEWVFSESERVAILQPAKLNVDWLMLVVSRPQCAFSRIALESIYADAGLSNLLAGHTKWIMGQGNDFNFDLYQHWNKKYPHAPVTLVHKNSEWPLDSLSSTPIFYFLQHGKVIESFSGWPKDGSHKAKLIAALDRIAPK